MFWTDKTLEANETATSDGKPVFYCFAWCRLADGVLPFGKSLGDEGTALVIAESSVRVSDLATG